MPFRFNPFTKKLDIIDVTAIPPGTVATLTGDTGGAVSPDGSNNINLLTGAGLTSTGTPINNTITFTLDGVYSGSATTIGAVTQTLITIPMADGSTTTFDVLISGFESTLPGAVGSSLIATFIRTAAGVPTIVAAADDQQNVSATLSGVSYTITGSGANVIVTVTGQAGVTINWTGIARTITAP